jgi:hypothetical protein
MAQDALAHSAEQWSTATNTRARPSVRVTVSVMSVPHITSTAVGVIVPSCARCSGRPTRRAEVRMPAWRRRAQIFL